MKTKKKIVHKAGKRKAAIARTTIKEGDGKIRINKKPLENFQPEVARMKIQETLMLASPYVDVGKIDIHVNVRGGGVMGQTDAIVSSIARSLVEYSNSDELMNEILRYDRTLIAGDHRLTEVHKPSQSSKGPRHKRQKSYR
jgi:small subunit ribosomal protein S9